MTEHHTTPYNHCSETPDPTYQIAVHITRSSDTALQSHAGISRREKTLYSRSHGSHPAAQRMAVSWPITGK